METWQCPKCTAKVSALNKAVSVTCGGKDPKTGKMLHRPCYMVKT